jgi:hypothetical protein
MADLYSQVVRGDGVSTYTVGANNRKTKHSTFDYGTPKIYPLVISRTDEGSWTGHADAGSDFHKVVAVIQTRAEIYGIGEVENTYFTILVNWNTLAQDNTASENTGEPNADAGDLDYLATEISNATSIGVTVFHGKIVGSEIDFNMDC